MFNVNGRNWISKEQKQNKDRGNFLRHRKLNGVNLG